MGKMSRTQRSPDVASEYDFSQARRGKYGRRCARGANLVVLAPDVANILRDLRSVKGAP